MRTLYIDPGLGGTGFAFFTKKGEPPHCSGVWQAGRAGTLNERCERITKALASIITHWNVERVVIEFPEVYQSGVSHAATTKGDLFKLVYLIGGMGQVARDLCEHHDPDLITPRDWKGQLPKDVVIKRIQKKWPDVLLTNHQADAVGMGLAALGEL